MAVPANIDPELPWGYWLRVASIPHVGDRFVDEDGTEWRTIRDAFWIGRLGFPDVNEAQRSQVLELVLAVLVSHSRATAWNSETLSDIFGGNLAFQQFHDHWLRSVGLLGAINDEGRKRDGVTTEDCR